MAVLNIVDIFNIQEKFVVNKTTKIGTTVAGILAASAMLAMGTAQAAVPDAPQSWEKCAGVAKKGMNDCGSLDGKHGCASQSSMDSDPNDWLYVPAGTCAKIGGKVAGVKPAK